MPNEERTDLRLSLAGAFELSRGGRVLDVTTPAQRVLAFLALNDRPVERSQAAAVLWPDGAGERAAGSLRSALWRIRQHGASIVEITQRVLRLSSAVRVDVREQVAWARRVTDPALPIDGADLREPFAAGELLGGWNDEWIRVERERLRQVRLHALETLSHRLVAAGRCMEALEVALIGVRSEPLRESGHRAVIAAHLAEGNATEALRHYRSYRDVLQTQLGVEPSDLMTRMVRALELVGARLPAGAESAFVTAARAVTRSPLLPALDAASSRS